MTYSSAGGSIGPAALQRADPLEEQAVPPSTPSPQDTVAPPLAERLASRLSALPETEGLEHVLAAIAQGVRALERPTRQAALADVLGATGEINVQGEAVQRLDALGTETFVAALRDCGLVAALACEELEGSIHLSDAPDHPYLVLFDPVDGSSNIDVAMTIGSIFGIYRRAYPEPLSDETLLRPGREQLAAAYAIYGSSTLLVVASAAGVDGFTLDPESGEFRLTHPDIRIPPVCPYYSINEHYAGRWEPSVQRAVAALRRQYSLRYAGSLAADFHRGLLKGGIFLYPGDRTSPSGKLRLAYEANPLAFVAEQAGGAASNGRQRILDIAPRELHQRTPLIVGNADVVRAVEAAIAAAPA